MISLHYTSHTKAYNTYYAQCDIVEQSTPLHRVIAKTLRPPPDWRRPPGRPGSTWLTVIDEDVQPQNFGVHTAWRKAKDRDTWHQVVGTATLCKEFATKKKNKGRDGWT